MKDSIYRQAAIDDIKAVYEWHDTVTEDRILDHLHRLPSAEPLTEEDYTELRDRFGEYVEFVVRDMITGKGERWIKVKDGDE